MDISKQRINGGKLGPGHRFDPTDEEFVFDFFAKKVLHHPIWIELPEYDSCNIDPWNLLEMNRAVFYFVKKKDEDTKIINTLSGHWKESEEEEVIVCEERDEENECHNFEGRRKTFAFYGDAQETSKSWIMYEFRLLYSSDTRSSSARIPQAEVDKWRAVKVMVKEENVQVIDEETFDEEINEETDEEIEEEEADSDESYGEEVIQSR